MSKPARSMISFIIPAHNEESCLAQTLDALTKSADTVGRPFEIIVVNDASTDKTREIASSYDVRVLDVDLRQIAAVRNAGAGEAAGDMFIFVDADTQVPAKTIQRAVESMESGVVGGGAVVKFDGTIPFYARIILFLMIFLFRQFRLAAGCFLFCTRDAFEKVGGFDKTLYASEELTMSQMLKRHGRFVILPEHVITSGRKLRQYSFRELTMILVRLTLAGPEAVKSRDRLDLWYNAKRE